MRYVYVPEGEADNEVVRGLWPGCEIIEVPNMSIAAENSLTIQSYLRGRGLDHLIRPFPGQNSASLYDSLQRGWKPE